VNLSDLRRHYTYAGLSETDLRPSPFDQFAIWFREAIGANLCEPNAMTLATCTPDGEPDARVVLLKEFDERGLVFYTNYDSVKGRQLEANPRAALLFHWCEMERQVRVSGTVIHVSDEEADAYFRSRPEGSRLGAWASAQSTPISSRELLEQQYEEVAKRFSGSAIPRPPHWGGFRVIPLRWEFWQGRSSRLHDRLCYVLEDSAWRIVRLSP
jgi:pyridoxamine 5'-phosphate oxidase